VVGERVQAWLNGTLLLDYRDSRFRAGGRALDEGRFRYCIRRAHRSNSV